MRKSTITNSNSIPDRSFEDICKECPLFKSGNSKVVRGISADGVYHADILICPQMAACKILFDRLKEKEEKE